MPQSFDAEAVANMKYLVGDERVLAAMPDVAPKGPFDEEVLDFLDAVSKRLLKDREARAFSDVITFAFWIRRAGMQQLKEKHKERGDYHRIGRGVAFHIAPSNVPVNYAYSLTAGLLAGNANIVKAPSKDFEQVTLINRVITEVLTELPAMKPYLCLVRYGHENEINDALSAIADVRIIWGGDNTIAEIRKSPLHSRAVEIAFADRYSLAVIDADAYLAAENKEAVATDFFNDTYLTDQNACTSPRAVIWTGKEVDRARALFWEQLHTHLLSQYQLQPVQSVNKLTSSYRALAAFPGAKLAKSDDSSKDNLIVRIEVPTLSGDLMEYKDNSGFFFEYQTNDVQELVTLCKDTHCQTIGYFGTKELLEPLLQAGLKGVDRIVPIGKTMDFELIWDGYALLSQMTRSVIVH